MLPLEFMPNGQLAKVHGSAMYPRLIHTESEIASHEKLERAEENLAQSVRRYLNHCPSKQLTLSIVNAEIRYWREDLSRTR